jgi:DNA repair protein RadA/Sms
MVDVRDMRLNVQRGFKLGTKMSSINVPQVLRARRSTGLDWVDEALGGGGFAPSIVGMLTGMPGTGKSTLLRQMADGFTRQGHVVVYNTGEESLYQAKMKCDDMDLQCGFEVGEEVQAGSLIKYLKDLQTKNVGKQVIFLQDSLQTLDDGKYADGGKTGGTPVRVVEMITDWAKETYGIAVFVAQATKNGDFSGKATIKHAIDSYMKLLWCEDKKSPVYGSLLFEVTKNRYGCTGKTYVMGITGKGLEVRGSYVKGQDWAPPGND